jgi:hypothetical protein
MLMPCIEDDLKDKDNAYRNVQLRIKPTQAKTTNDTTDVWDAVGYTVAEFRASEISLSTRLSAAMCRPVSSVRARQQMK